ncbi:alpha/beta hydrolase [Aureispira anguillae]|uniref:Esterase family protein n=1 Tax=Aureispira anguillae TaxID=2864201 RepID=A0A915YEE6_9BACT|nr:esterase family protein [Aureispira anguillae]BDS11600.1 esterase family protein [Aureispira anguillae]
MGKNIYWCLFVTIALLACTGDRISQHNQAITKVFKTGNYTHSSFTSKSRGQVDFNVYLPSNWSQERAKKYPLLILLHGQGEDENTFIQAFPVSSLNHWMKNQLIPEMVIVAVRGGTNTNEMQWYTNPNEEMITSDKKQELRRFCAENFHTTMESTQISVIGHSRGATGALNFALYFPTKFASVVSSAFVSDYAIKRLKQAVDKNLDEILKSNIKIELLIGDQDQYVQNNNRKGSPIMSDYLRMHGIQHKFKIIENKGHRLIELWEYPTNLHYLEFIAESWGKDFN